MYISMRSEQEGNYVLTEKVTSIAPLRPSVCSPGALRVWGRLVQRQIVRQRDVRQQFPPAAERLDSTRLSYHDSFSRTESCTQTNFISILLLKLSIGIVKSHFSVQFSLENCQL